MLRQAAIAAPVLAILIVTSAYAVKPSEWAHRTEADFLRAERENIVVTNLGEVRLAQDTHLIASLDSDAIVYDLAQLDDGRIFVALGPEARLAQLDGESLDVIEEFSGSQIFSMTTDGESLWVGVSGRQARVEQRSGEDMAVSRSVDLPDALYVWDLALANDRLYAATGTEGRIFAFRPGQDDPELETVLDARPSNILTLAADVEGRIYAGTDGEGLVYRLTRENGGYTPFVLYDAPEPEIGALLVLDDGTVYAGTADADQARPGRLEAAREDTRGRPDGAATPDEPEVVPDDGEEVPEPPLDPEPQAKAEAPDAAEGGELDEGPEADEADTRPTPEQYEHLRRIVSERLSEARQSGRIRTQTEPQPSAGPAQAQGGSRPAAAGRSTSGGGSSRNGNAIYRISPDGFVHEIFRESVMILSLLQQNGALIVATGNEGQIYRVDPASEEVTILADLDPRQIPALFQTDDGDILLGTANPGLLFELRSGYAQRGTLTSPPLDADQISLWGKLHVKAENRDNAFIEVRTRSGNVSDPELGTWSAWSAPQRVEINGGESAYLDVQSPSARFLQYQLVLGADAGVSPTIYETSLRYLMPNLPPRLTSLKAEYNQARRAGGANDAPQPQHTLKIEWEASDPNEDALSYKIEARPFGDNGPYVTIAENLDSTSYDWDTRTVPDGRYVLRLTASDAPDNIPDQVMTATRRSDPVTVDNTPPDVHDLDIQVNGNGEAVLTARVTNELTPIRSVRYRVSGNDDWNLILPEDSIYDSTEESFRVTIRGLEPGTRVLSLRATDTQGNTRYLSRTFSVQR